MALPIVFNNTVYPVGFVGQDDTPPAANVTLDNTNAGSITVNGRVNAIGDSVTATGAFYQGESATTVRTLYATQYDSSGAIQFTDRAASPNAFIFSNTSLETVDTVMFSNNTLGEYSAAPCFVTGTLIRTVRGEVAVEDLVIGDRVVTASGEERPITWIGHRHVDIARHRQPEAVRPVVVRADAFGPGLPLRDLFLSPDHAVRVSVLDEVLIPIKHLVNDATIVQVEAAEVTYWHVELDSHDILLAEGLPAESFLDTGVRAAFENAGAFTTLHPDFSPLTLDDFCRPLVQDGPIVDAVRTRLLARAAALGWTLTSEDDLHVVADGVAIYPEREGAVARFSLPAGACAVRLVSKSFVPERVRVGAGDGRRLGVALRGVSVVEASGVVRSLPIAHALFAEGFSFVQGEAGDAWRWTDGDAVLPVALWAGATGAIGLVVETAPEHGTLQAWQAPRAATEPCLAEAEPLQRIA